MRHILQKNIWRTNNFFYIINLLLHIFFLYVSKLIFFFFLGTWSDNIGSWYEIFIIHFFFLLKVKKKLYVFLVTPNTILNSILNQKLIINIYFYNVLLSSCSNNKILYINKNKHFTFFFVFFFLLCWNIKNNARVIDFVQKKKMNFLLFMVFLKNISLFSLLLRGC